MNKIYIYIWRNSWEDEYECKPYKTKEAAILEMKKELFEEIEKYTLDAGYTPIVNKINNCKYKIIYATYEEFMLYDTGELDEAYYEIIEADLDKLKTK